MEALYIRVSTLDQNLERQKVNGNFDHIVEDKCSGAIPFFDRTGGKEILKFVELNILSELYVHSIDRLGRNLLDILNTIHFFTEKKICINFINQGLKTLDENGIENSISKLIISILGVVAEMERNQARERQREGIALAKLKNVYRGRLRGAKETNLDFLSKPKNKKALEYLKKGYKAKDAAELSKVHINTITKIKKLGLK